MAFEIKTMDVTNEAEAYFIELYGSFGWRLKSSQRVFNKTSRPVGTVSYGSVSYVHTQTETVDFTKLVFERDTSMENYERLESLESQYFALQSMLPEKEPEYSSTIGMEEWVKDEPEIVNESRSYLPAAILGSLLGFAIICIIIAVLYRDNDASFIEIFKSMWGVVFLSPIVGLPFAYFAVQIVYGIINKKALKIALSDPSSAERAELERQYQKMHAEAVAYGENKARMILILAEAARLAKLVK